MSWSMLSQVLALVFGIATQSALAWTLGAEGRGAYAVCFVYATLVGVVFELGTGMAAVYGVSSGRFSLAKGVQLSLLLALGTGILAAAVGWVLLQFPIAYFNKADLSAFRISLLIIPAQLVFNTLVQLLMADRRFRAYAVVTAVQGLLLLALVVVMITLWGWDVQGALWAHVASYTVGAAGILAYHGAAGRIAGDRPRWEDIRFMIGYGSRFYFGKVANTVNVQVATIMMAFFATTEQIGLYSVAIALGSRVSLVADSLVGPLIPRVAQDRETGRAVSVAQAVRVSLVISSAVLGLIALLATPLVAILFSPEFLPAVPVIRLLAVGMAIRFGFKVFVPYFIGTNRPGLTSMSVVSGVLVNAVLVWLLMPRLGLMGAAWAAVAGYVVSSALLLWAFWQHTGMKLSEIWAFRRSDWSPLLSATRRLRSRFT